MDAWRRNKQRLKQQPSEHKSVECNFLSDETFIDMLAQKLCLAGLISKTSKFEKGTWVSQGRSSLTSPVLVALPLEPPFSSSSFAVFFDLDAAWLNEGRCEEFPGSSNP